MREILQAIYKRFQILTFPALLNPPKKLSVVKFSLSPGPLSTGQAKYQLLPYQVDSVRYLGTILGIYTLPEDQPAFFFFLNYYHQEECEH